MSQNINKDDNGLIISPIDAEDFAYNIAHQLDLNYPQQVELEAALNQLTSSGLKVSNVAEILKDLFNKLSKPRNWIKDMSSQVVAFLSYRYPEPLGCREKVVCLSCKDKSAHAPVSLYMENLLPYKQTCHECQAVISPGQTDAWGELFPVPKPLPRRRFGSAAGTISISDDFDA